MWKSAVRTVFDSVLQIRKITSALFFHGIEWTIAENTVEFLCIFYFVTRKIFTFFILKKFVTHLICPEELHLCRSQQRQVPYDNRY